MGKKNRKVRKKNSNMSGYLHTNSKVITTFLVPIFTAVVLVILVSMVRSTTFEKGVPETSTRASEPIFAKTNGPPGFVEATPGQVKRSSFTKVNSKELVTENDVDEYLFNLFDDVSYTVVADSIVKPSNEKTIMKGHVKGKPNSQVTVAVNKGVAAGTIRVEDRLFKLNHIGNGVHVVKEVDAVNEPFPEAEPIPVETERGIEDVVLAASDPTIVNDDGSIIDVLVVYTPAARNRNGDQAGIEALIDLAVAETNTAYLNSQINTQLRLVHVAEVNYIEAGNMSTDLSRVRGKTDGYMDEVHALRDTYNADMVSIIVDSMDFCGIAYLMTTLSNNFNVSAFSAVYYDCATGYYSFGHELGHNMGSHHDRAAASGPGVFPYSFGYWYNAGGYEQNFRTVMSYNCPTGCTRRLYFSNPNVLYNGIPMGIDHNVDPVNSADNARSINEAKLTIANWRDSAPVPTSTPTPTPTPTSTPIPPTPTSTPIPPTPTPTPIPTPTTTPSPTPPPQIGILGGTVRDASTQAVISNVKVEVSIPGRKGKSGRIATATTGTNGVYLISPLDVGDYDVKASVKGYNKQTIAGVYIQPGPQTVVDFALSVKARGGGPKPKDVYDAVIDFFGSLFGGY